MEITILIDREHVLNALMRTTGYIGAKQIDADADAYRRISLTEGDRRLLDTLWQEARDRLCMELRRLIAAEGMEGESYRMDLCLSEAFDTRMTSTLQSCVELYMIQHIAAKWLSITDRVSAATYADAAARTLTDISRHAYCKRKPQRPEYMPAAAGDKIASHVHPQ